MSEEIVIPESLEEMQEKIKSYQAIASGLLNENMRLVCTNAKKNNRHEANFKKLQVTAASGIEASNLILNQIVNSHTAHWQKKENIRLAIGVLSTLQSQIMKPACSYDDDF